MKIAQRVHQNSLATCFNLLSVCGRTYAVLFNMPKARQEGAQRARPARLPPRRHLLLLHSLKDNTPLLCALLILPGVTPNSPIPVLKTKNQSVDNRRPTNHRFFLVSADLIAYHRQHPLSGGERLIHAAAPSGPTGPVLELWSRAFIPFTTSIYSIFLLYKRTKRNKNQLFLPCLFLINIIIYKYKHYLSFFLFSQSR